MIKEKAVFWPLAAIFIGMLIFGFLSQGKKKEALGFAQTAVDLGGALIDEYRRTLEGFQNKNP